LTRPVVLVTGAARGIGRAIADDLARDHATAITFHTAPQPGAVFASQGPDRLALPFDATTDDPAHLIARVIARFGRLDALVNTAGLVRDTPLDAFDPAAAAEVMQVNALAPSP
jgi:3-oxoacyl-[acyl-carrier protein] reductase